MRKRGAQDIVDDRDWIAEERLGVKKVSLPEYVNWFEQANMYPKDQRQTNRCTAYALAGAVECAYRLAGHEVDFIPEDYVWAEQLRTGGSEKRGDYLGNCLKAGKKEGFAFNGKRYKISGYATIKNRTPKDLQKWLARRHPVYTGVVTNMWTSARNTDILKITKSGGGHAIWLCGYEYVNGELYFLAVNSWGNWSVGEDGIFKIPANEVLKSFEWRVPFIEIQDLTNK